MSSTSLTAYSFIVKKNVYNLVISRIIRSSSLSTSAKVGRSEISPLNGRLAIDSRGDSNSIGGVPVGARSRLVLTIES